MSEYNHWSAIDFDFDFGSTSLYLKEIKDVDGALLIHIEHHDDHALFEIKCSPFSYRVTDESYFWNPFETYENNDSLSYKHNRIFYTKRSEYIDWFFSVNERQNVEYFDKDDIYHVQILLCDYVVDLICTELPTVTQIK